MSGPTNTTRESSRAQKRKFPGPAGLLPKHALNFPNASEPVLSEVNSLTDGCEKVPAVPSSQTTTEDLLSSSAWKQVLSDLDDDSSTIFRDFSIKKMLMKANNRSLPKGKVPLIIAIIESLDYQGSSASIILRDNSGKMRGSVHQDLVKDPLTALRVGFVLVLRQSSVISPSSRTHVLNVTPSNIALIYTAGHDGVLKTSPIRYLSQPDNTAPADLPSLSVIVKDSQSELKKLESDPANSVKGSNSFHINSPNYRSMPQNRNRPKLFGTDQNKSPNINLSLKDFTNVNNHLHGYNSPRNYLKQNNLLFRKNNSEKLNTTNGNVINEETFSECTRSSSFVNTMPNLKKYTSHGLSQNKFNNEFKSFNNGLTVRPESVLNRLENKETEVSKPNKEHHEIQRESPQTRMDNSFFDDDDLLLSYSNELLLNDVKTPEQEFLKNVGESNLDISQSSITSSTLKDSVNLVKNLSEISKQWENHFQTKGDNCGLNYSPKCVNISLNSVVSPSYTCTHAERDIRKEELMKNNYSSSNFLLRNNTDPTGTQDSFFKSLLPPVDLDESMDLFDPSNKTSNSVDNLHFSDNVVNCGFSPQVSSNPSKNSEVSSKILCDSFKDSAHPAHDNTLNSLSNRPLNPVKPNMFGAFHDEMNDEDLLSQLDEDF